MARRPGGRQLYSADCEPFSEADSGAISLLPFSSDRRARTIVIINHEHSEFRWGSFEEALTMVPCAEQRHVLRRVKVEFVEREPVRQLFITAADV